MRAKAWLVVTPLTLCLGCGNAPPAPPYRPVADVKAIMANIMEPAADAYWDTVGTVIDTEGEHQIVPQTQEDWDTARNDAYVVTEAGNLLMMPTRAKDNAEWMQLARALIESGEKAIRAAEAKDTAAVFNAGGELYDACTNCHAKYSPEIVKANLR
jgi:hypothetical protein